MWSGVWWNQGYGCGQGIGEVRVWVWSWYGCGQGMGEVRDMGVVRCMHAHGWVKLLGMDLNLKMSNEGE